MTSRHGGVDIEAWTEQAISAMNTVKISAATIPSDIRGTSVTLDIPLDALPVTEEQQGVPQAIDAAALRAQYARRREPLRRDSMKRREALLKGKEGSRRRQRWENNHLLGNPWLEPPEPKDFEITPTHRVQAVPYYLASNWDSTHARAQKKALEEARATSRKNEEQVGKIPKDLKQRLKRSKAAKGMFQDLEEQVREFVRLWDDKERELKQQGLADMDSSEDDEIVFVGREGQHTREKQQKNIKKDKLIFESLVDDHGAAFGRWLVHSIASYYNLRTWSKTTGNPARREAYVGIKNPSIEGRLPQPLWVSLCS